MPEANAEATVVLSGCHSLVLIDEKVAGDPVEAAALKAIKWEILEKKQTECRPKPAHLASRGSFTIKDGNGGRVEVNSLEIETRHHFSSKLQRMSIVARLGKRSQGIVLTKGSPEAVALLLKKSAIPQGYDESAGLLAKEGMRVLGLAYKVLNTPEEIAACSNSRAVAESELEFAGFVAFTCRVRKDTGEIIKQLKDGKHQIAMVTGDAILTAIHVAKEVAIVEGIKEGILVLAIEDEKVVWKSYESGKTWGPFVASDIPKLYKRFDFATDGKSLAAATVEQPEIRKHLEHFAVFARMTPDEKEGIIMSLKDCGKVCMMCGDGANDVGALKQAQVGVALLSGFGDLNVDRGEKAKEPDIPLTAIMTKEQLEELERCKPSELKRKLRAIGVAPEDYPDCVEKSDLVKLYRTKLQKKAAESHDKKNVLASKSKKTPQEMRAEMEKERRELMMKKQVRIYG